MCPAPAPPPSPVCCPAVGGALLLLGAVIWIVKARRHKMETQASLEQDWLASQPTSPTSPTTPAAFLSQSFTPSAAARF